MKNAKYVISAVLIVVISLMPVFCCGQTGAQIDKPENSIGETDRSLTGLVAEMEIADMNKGMQQWTDSRMIEELRAVKLTDEYVKDLYKEFMGTIVSPPAPDDTKEYGIEHGEESLKKVIALGRRIHNLGQAVSGEDLERYGDLLPIMRDILYLDSQHIPLAIKHDNSRDVYWYSLHNSWLKSAQEAYGQLFPADKAKGYGDQINVQELMASAQKGSGQARLDLAKRYLQKGGEENQRQAAKLLRAVAVEEQEDFLMPAYLMLHDIREMIRSRHPEITDKEYEKADNSIGVALLGKGDIDKAIDALIEEAGCLSSSAQIQLSIMYQYDVKGYPHDDPRILKFYEETAQEGLSRSQFFLGHIYLNGWGVEKDEEKGQRLLAQSDWENREFKLP